MTGLDWNDLRGFSKFVKADGVMRKPFSARGRAAVRSKRPSVGIQFSIPTKRADEGRRLLLRSQISMTRPV